MWRAIAVRAGRASLGSVAVVLLLTLVPLETTTASAGRAARREPTAPGVWERPTGAGRRAVPTGSRGPAGSEVACGHRIKQDFVLQNDLVDCPYAALSIVGTKKAITVNLNGHAITGRPQAGREDWSIGLLLSRNRRPVRVVGPGMLEGHFDGIRVAGTGNVTLENVTIRDSWDDGIEVRKTRGATIRDNLVENSNDTGIAIHGKHRNVRITTTGVRVLDNQVRGARWALIGLHPGTSDSRVEGNTVETTIAGDGILVNGSNDNDIVDNRVISVTRYGIHLMEGSSGNTLSDNEAEGSQVGIRASDSRGNTISGNTASGNSVLDLQDANNACLNTWTGNMFGTRNPACIQ